jgi:hypothetical protein
MRVREAKDFLIEQIAVQAQVENVTLSALEKRMMYFTEAKSALEDLATLNAEFEAQNDRAKFEKRISRLMRHAHKRVRKESAEKMQAWSRAIRCLQRGDHYLLVMWDQRPGIKVSDLYGLGVVVLAFAAFAGLEWLVQQFPPPNPHLMLTLFLAVVLASFLFLRPIGKGLEWVVDKTLWRFLGPNEKEEDAG